MAASQAKRDMVYFTFGDKSLQNDITEFHSYLIAKKCVVGDVSAVHTKFETFTVVYICMYDSCNG